MNVDNLKNRDYVLIIDKSGSMEERDCAGGQTRWKAAQESTQAIANRCNEYDPDGITIIPFAGSFKEYANTTPDKVKDIFNEQSPMGGTTLAPVLQHVFDQYILDKRAGKSKPNGVMALVITDGCPQDEADVSKAIATFTKRLDSREEFGLAFFQVGKDRHAHDFLKSLDDDLVSHGAKFDIVNTKTMEEIETIGLTDCLIAALTE